MSRHSRARSFALRLWPLTAALLIVACRPPQDAPAPSPQTPVAADPCLPVPDEKIANIALGLTVSGGGTLDAATARAVRSTDYAEVYFIAAEIEGPGLEGPGHIGVWASNSLEPADGLILAVSGLASEFTDWPDSATTDAQMSSADASALQAEACVAAQQP